MTGFSVVDSAGFVTLGMVALVGLILKLIILFNIGTRTPIARGFALLCMTLLLQNVMEFLGYFTYLKSPLWGELLINGYMLVLYFIPPAFVVLVLRLIESGFFLPFSIVAYLGATVISVAHLFGLVVTGYEFIGWSVISTPAPLYYFAMLLMGLTLLFAFSMLIVTVFTSKQLHIVSRCKICLLAFIPMLLVFVGVVAGRMAGFQSSSAISLPIATLLFLFIMLHETKDNLYWLSTKFQMVIALLFMDKNKTTEEVISQLEDIRIRTALRTTGGNQKDAAKLVCLPASTLNKKIAKYGIDVKEYRVSRPGTSSTAA